MPNVSRINGFRVVGHLNGSKFNGQSKMYFVSAAADEMLAGDVVKLGGSADANGIPSVDLAAAGDVPMGIVLSVINPKLDPAGKMSTGSILLDLPTVTQIASGAAGYVLVADAPDVVLEVEASGTTIAADVGLNASHANAARDATTRTSPASLDGATKAVTATLNFQILGLVQRVDNELGAAAKVLVRFNRHQYQSVGTTGI